MAKMKAFQIVEWGQRPEFVDVDIPSPGAGEVLLKMGGAGLCRSDLDLIDARPGEEPYAAVLPAGFTLGHENAGRVAAFGEGITDLAEGDGVVVHHMKSCGHCDFCLEGVDQHCTTFARGAVSITRGLGMDGGLAPYLVVPRRELVKIGKLSPVDVAPLTDAGVTAYHAVNSVKDRLKPGTFITIIGLGGLGAYGVQLARLLTQAGIVALDVAPGRLNSGRELGADHVLLSDERAAEQIMDLTKGRGSDAIIDFVGSDATLALAAKISRPQGRIVLVGMAGGSINVAWGSLATSCEVAISMGSTRADLQAVCRLAEEGKLKIERELVAFDEVEAAYERLRAGQVLGRAVVTF